MVAGVGRLFWGLWGLVVGGEARDAPPWTVAWRAGPSSWEPSRSPLQGQPWPRQQWPEMQLGTAAAVGRLLSWALLGRGGAWDLPLGV